MECAGNVRGNIKGSSSTSSPNRNGAQGGGDGGSLCPSNSRGIDGNSNNTTRNDIQGSGDSWARSSIDGSCDGSGILRSESLCLLNGEVLTVVMLGQEADGKPAYRTTFR